MDEDQSKTAETETAAEPTIAEVVKTAFVDGITNQFVALHHVVRAVKMARDNNKIVHVTVVFMPAGAILVQEPVVLDPEVEPAAEAARPAEQPTT